MEYFMASVANDGQRFQIRRDESILEAMKRQHIKGMVYGCNGGGCGRCLIRVDAGTYEIIKRMSRAHIAEDEEAKGIVLACAVKVLSNVVITIFPKEHQGGKYGN